MRAANNDIKEVSYFKVFTYKLLAYPSSRVEEHVHTTFDCSMTARHFQVTSTYVCLTVFYAMPASGALLDQTPAEYGAFIVVKYARLASRFLHSRCSGLQGLCISRVQEQAEPLPNEHACNTVYLFPVAVQSF